MKKLFIIVGIIISVTQVLIDSLNQLNLPEHSRMKISAVLMLSMLVAGGAHRYLNPEYQNKTLWITACLFVVYVLGAIAQNYNYLTDLGVSDNALGFIRLAFTAINMTLNLTIKEFKPSDN